MPAMGTDHRTESTPSVPVRVVAYNVLFKVPPHPDKLRALNPDILLLQELAGLHNTNPKAIAAEVAGNPDMEVFYRQHRLRGGGGSAILSRLAMRNTCEHTLLQSTLNPRLRRVYMEAAIELPTTSTDDVAASTAGNVLTVGLAHLATPLTSKRKRWVQTDRLIALLQDKNSHYLLAGDFNAPPSSPLVKAILDNTNLENCGPDFSEPSWSYETWTRTHGLGNIGRKFDRRLDYCFGTPDIVRAIANVQFGTAWPSDHCPLILDLDAAQLPAAA